MAEHRLAKKKALITGGSDGIGLAIAQAFAVEGADLWMVARDATKLSTAAELCRSQGVEVFVTEADLTDLESAEKVRSEVHQKWSCLDVLVNNAGMARFTEFANVTDSELHSQLHLNLLSPYLLTQKLLSLLTVAKGNVVNISSTSAHRLIPGRPASVYAMTKGGLNSLTKALALELGPVGIRVNAIAPGKIKTPLTENMINSFSAERKMEYDKFVRQSFALGQLGEPEDVAHMAVYLASPYAKWTTGAVLIVDGGLSTN